MQDKTIREIAENKRIQTAFLNFFKATEEEKLHPRRYVVDKIKKYIKETVDMYEEEEALKLAREAVDATREEFVI